MWSRRRNQALDGLDDEIRDHIERETEINIARGMTPDEARRQARLAFGNVTLVQEDARAAWTWTWLEQARQDLRFGARILKNSPGSSVTAAVLIALVIGINTTIFSMMNALVTQPAPGVNPEGLVRIAIPERPGAPFVSYPDYLDYRGADHDAAGAHGVHERTRHGDVRCRQLRADRRGRRCQLLRHDRRPADARANVHTETKGARPTRPRLVAIVSYRAWQDQFGGDENIVGRAIEVNNQPATVIGVAPANFRGTMLSERTDVWLPLLMYWGSFSPETLQRSMTDRSETPVDMIGRLAPGKSIAAAQADFATMQARLNRSYPIVRPPRYCRRALCRDCRRCDSCGRSDVSRDLLGHHDAHRADRVRERRESHAVACGRTSTRDRRSPIARGITLESRPSAAG